MVAFANPLRTVAIVSKIRDWYIHAKKNNKPQNTYKIFHISKIYFTFTLSFILQIGTTKRSLTNANKVQIAVTPRALPIISLMYMEKYVSVHSHHQSIKSVNDNEILLIFNGIVFFISFAIFFIFFCIDSSF